VAQPGGLKLGVVVVTVNPAKTAEPIEVPFWGEAVLRELKELIGLRHLVNMMD